MLLVCCCFQTIVLWLDFHQFEPVAALTAPGFSLVKVHPVDACGILLACKDTKKIYEARATLNSGPVGKTTLEIAFGSYTTRVI